jgi:hypothetical protein
MMTDALFGSTPRTCDAAHSGETILENQWVTIQVLGLYKQSLKKFNIAATVKNPLTLELAGGVR